MRSRDLAAGDHTPSAIPECRYPGASGARPALSENGHATETPRGLGNTGVRAALLAAVLFDASAPLAKLLLGDISPWLLAHLLYFGAGPGMCAWRIIRRAPRVRLARREVPWLARNRADAASLGRLGPSS